MVCFLFAVVVVLSSLLVCLLCFAFWLPMWFAFCLLLWFAFCLLLWFALRFGFASTCSIVNKFMLFGFFSSSVFARFFRCCLELTLRFVYEPRFRVLGYRLFFIKNWSRLWLNFCGLCGHLLPFRLIKFLKGVGFLGYFGVLKK